MLIQGNIKKHPFHLVDLSPWPFYMALGLMITGIGIINILVGNTYNMALLGFILII